VECDCGRRQHPPGQSLFCRSSTNHNTIYAGNDGGIYKSTNGGTTWDDTINEHEHHAVRVPRNASHLNAVAVAGTQDNGTQMFRNHHAFTIQPW
jgi:photosystem II stability/assembly factor-like uncharacterized protein